MPDPWNDWYHVMTHTYGTWLPGDPRGFRTRHHREHVEGDYKRPPPSGLYDSLHARSKRLLKQAPVHLPTRLRAIVLNALAAHLVEGGVEVLIAALDSHHLHLLARFPAHDPRLRVGIAKHHATKTLKDHLEHCPTAQFALPRGLRLWSKRSKSLPIRDRAHQLQTFHYIRNHGARGSALFLHRSLTNRGR